MEWPNEIFHNNSNLFFNFYNLQTFYNSCARETVAKKWLTGSSVSYTALQNIVLDQWLMNDLPNLVWFKHSGNLEVYHNLLLKYCPKRVSLSYEGMSAPTQLAVLDRNCNINRN